MKIKTWILKRFEYRSRNIDLVRFLVSLDNKSVDAKGEEIEKATQIYEDALDRGDQAALLKDHENDQDLYELDVGNVKPG